MTERTTSVRAHYDQIDLLILGIADDFDKGFSPNRDELSVKLLPLGIREKADNLRLGLLLHADSNLRHGDYMTGRFPTRQWVLEHVNHMNCGIEPGGQRSGKLQGTCSSFAEVRRY